MFSNYVPIFVEGPRLAQLTHQEEALLKISHSQMCADEGKEREHDQPRLQEESGVQNKQ